MIRSAAATMAISHSARVEGRPPRRYLDVLINNAGGQFGTTRETTTEGHEKTFAINTMAPFLLTNLLVGQLAKSPSGRVVTVSSESYRSGGRPRLDDIELTHSYSLRRSYGLSKLYVYWIMRQFVPELERRAITNVTVNTVEPGSTRTSLGRVSMHNHLMRVVTLLWTPMMWSIGKAAATSIYLATSSEVEGVTGRFYGNLKEKEINPRWISVTGQQQIWVDIVVSTRARFASSGSERTGGSLPAM